MPNAFPCPNTPPDCECIPFPVRNFSQEAPDVPVEFCTVTVAARTGTSFASPCTRDCENPNPDNPLECVLESDNFFCAESSAQDCQNHDPDPPNRYTNTFFNTEQTCVVECPDGSTFSWTVPAQLIASAWAGDADARAFALACKRAKEHRICFVTESPLTPCCVGTFTSIPIIAQGGSSPYSFAVTSGTIPPGMTFDPVGLLEGTPTLAGTYVFVITVTDSIASTQSKSFSLRVVEITTTSPLPSGTVGTPYSQALTAAGTSGTVVWSFVAGELPAGLTLSTAGVISGTPLMPETQTFTVEFLDGGGASCQKEFELEIVAQVALQAYWTYDNYNTVPVTDQLLDSTANANNLDILSAYNVVPGRVNNCMSTFENKCETFAPVGMDNVASTGFTICGWIKFDFDQEGTITLFLFEWNAFNVSLEFNTNALILTGDLDVFPFSADDVTVPYPADGAWHFYRAYLDTSGLLHLQIDNGAVFSSAGMTYTDSVCNRFYLQGDTTAIPDTQNGFDETGFWKRVLSTTEASNLYNGGAGITFGNPLMPP